MTDARLRGPWLNTMRFDDLSDAAWRVFCYALMWSNENGTDGLIPTRYLKFLHPDGTQDRAFLELEAKGLWEPVSVGYQFIDWDTALGQSTAATVNANRESAAERQRKKRKRDAEKPGVTGDVTRDVGRDVRANVGQDKDKDRLRTEGVTPDADSANESWPVTPIGQGASAA